MPMMMASSAAVCVGDVDAKFVFADGHVDRLKKKHSWYEYDPMTGISSCLACASAATSGSSKKRKRDDGVQIDSGRISGHAREPSHPSAVKLWRVVRGEKPAEKPPDAAAEAAAAKLQQQLARARAEKASTREPLTRAA